MNLFQVIILSIVEGITEFLPISSTGHLVLTSKLINLSQTEFVKTFEIAIQLGAIASVVFLYWKTLITDKEIFKKIIIAFIPTGILGLVFYKVVKDYLLGNSNVTLISLFIGGVLIILFERYFKGKDHNADIHKLSYKNAFIVGLFQSLSMIPGVSRAAATIFGGLFMGMNRESAVQFSFILAIPTMMAATGLDLIKSASSFSSSQFNTLAIGFIVSFIVALLTVKWLISYVKRYSFIPFGVYRVILAIIFFLLIK